MSQVHFCYVTAPSIEEAQKLATLSIEKKLAACANILPGMQSTYRWKGKIEQSQEVVIILKTTQSRLKTLKKEILKSHSYECPCFVSWKIDEGAKDFLNFVRREVNENK